MSYELNFKDNGVWERVRTTSQLKFCGIHLYSSFPFIERLMESDSSTTIVPLTKDDDTTWVKSIPESSRMVYGQIRDTEDIIGNQIDVTDADKLLILGITESENKGLVRIWYKRMKNGVTVKIQ